MNHLQEGELDRTKLSLEKARLDLQVKEANKFTYAQYIKEIDEMVDSGNNKSCCPTCNRAFKSEAEAREEIQQTILTFGALFGAIKAINIYVCYKTFRVILDHICIHFWAFFGQFGKIC